MAIWICSPSGITMTSFIFLSVSRGTGTCHPLVVSAEYVSLTILLWLGIVADLWFPLCSMISSSSLSCCDVNAPSRKGQSHPSVRMDFIIDQSSCQWRIVLRAWMEPNSAPGKIIEFRCDAIRLLRLKSKRSHRLTKALWQSQSMSWRLSIRVTRLVWHQEQ